MHFSFILPFFLGAASLLNSLPSPQQPHGIAGNGSSSQFITSRSSFLIRERTLHTSPAPAGDRHLSTNFSKASPSHRLQLFMNCSSGGPLPCGVVHQEQIVPVWILHGTTGPPPAWASHRVTCSCIWFSMGCRWISAPPWMSMGCRVTWLTMVFLTLAWSMSCTSFFTDFGVCWVVLLTYTLFSDHNLLLPSSSFFPFLNTSSQRCYRCCWQLGNGQEQGHLGISTSSGFHWGSAVKIGVHIWLVSV